MTRRDDGGVTRRDDGGVTRRDDGGVTRRDDGGGFVRVNLPSGLAARFEVLEVLPASGAEADLLLVADAAGVRRVVKLYRSGIEPDRDALEVLGGAKAHVVEVIDADLDDGVFFEVLEWCEHGSLLDLLVAEGGVVEVDDFVRQMSMALAHVHGLGLVHRDLKPANVLVRSVAPLKLVLADFGLVRAMDASVRFTSAFGTTEYAPPELASGEVSTAFDWWSLGMMIAELAGGRHPLALADGSFPSHQQLVSELVQRPVDLDHLDDRTRLICQGLLTRDRRHRWDNTQVDEWLTGGSPEVNDAAPASTTGQRGRSVLFDGAEHDNLASLAASLQSNWSEARRRLFAERDGSLIDEVERLCRDCGNAEAASLLRSQVTAREISRRFANLLVEMDPDLDPIFDGVRLTQAGLEHAAIAVTESSGDHRNTGVLNEIRNQNMLTVWRSLEGVEHGPSTQQSWTQHLDELAALRKQLPTDASKLTEPDTPTGHITEARLLLCALDNSHTTTLTAQAEQLDNRLANEQTWWKQLTTNTAATAITKLTTHPLATEQTHQQHNARRKKQREQQQQEQEREQQEREQEQQRRSAESARRRRPAPWVEGLTEYFPIAAVYLLASAGAQHWYRNINGVRTSYDVPAAIDAASIPFAFLGAVVLGALAFLGPRILGTSRAANRCFAIVSSLAGIVGSIGLVGSWNLLDLNNNYMDIGASGWFLLAGLVFLVGGAVALLAGAFGVLRFSFALLKSVLWRTSIS